MDAATALVLLQDGLTNGAIYGVLALSLVLAFCVTRVILIPQGEFVAYGALTASAMENGIFPASAWLLLALTVVTSVKAAVARPFQWRSLTATLVAPGAAVLG